MIRLFITGTDTDIGKTFVTSALALTFQSMGYKVGVFKPLQSGAIETPSGLLAPDIESVKKLSTEIKTKYSYLLKGEVSPALAAKLSGVEISIDKIKNDFEDFSKSLDIVLVEGAGGLCAPATENMLMADLIKALNIPAVLVTGAYLGSINHTLLSIKYMESLNLAIRGLIINNYPKNTEDVAVKNMTKELKEFTSVDILGIIERQENADNKTLIELFKDCANRLIS